MVISPTIGKEQLITEKSVFLNAVHVGIIREEHPGSSKA